MTGKPLALDGLAPLNVQRVPRKGSLSLHVADQLEALIGSGSIAVGQKLPGENGLCASFGVSRTVIREAIMHLKSLGLVKTRRGVGTTVIRTAAPEAMPAARIRPTTVADILQVLELRLSLEPAAAALAAQRHTHDDRCRLEEAHATFVRACQAQSQAGHEDYAFHHAVVVATGNPCFTTLYEQLSQCVIPRAKLLDFEIDSAASAPYLSRVEKEHGDILAAILARDEATARQAMCQHLERSRCTYAKYQET
ncbi:MAG: FadR/GntR family transcriptional regulator [Halomonas sp.]|nr:FadR/GntR family transcriptional regulator [Halomonas sp.]